MKVIVTGANGFIGVHTIRGLLKKGYNVEAVDIKTEGLKEFSNNKRCAIHDMRARAQYAPPRPGDIRNSCADISKAERVLSYKPRIGLEEGIRRLLQGSDVKAEP